MMALASGRDCSRENETIGEPLRTSSSIRADHRSISDLRASTSSRGLTETDQVRLSKLEEENKQYHKDVREMQDKLQKAKAVREMSSFAASITLSSRWIVLQFIKQQDKLFKEAHASEHHVSAFVALD